MVPSKIRGFKTLAPRLTHAQTHSKFEKSGVYPLKCPDCYMKYIGQTERSFRIRFQEHTRHFKYNNSKSKFALHLIENKHSAGRVDDIMEVLHVTNRGRLTV